MAYLGRQASKTALDANDIPDNSITAAKIVEGTITVGDIGTDAVGTDEIVNDAVTADKLANSINTEISANTAKVTNATHTGDVTGATALTIANDVAINTSGVITTTGAAAVGTATTSGSHFRVHQATTGTDSIRITGGNAANADMLSILVDQATESAFDFINCERDSDGSPVSAFKVDGYGNANVGGNINLTSSGHFYDPPQGYGTSTHSKKGVGVWEHFTWSTQANDTYRKMIQVQDSGGFVFCVAGDASTKNQKIYSYKITSPNYGVSAMTQLTSAGGGWNSGSFDLSYTNDSGTYYMTGKATSYYNSANSATFQIFFMQLN